METLIKVLIALPTRFWRGIVKWLGRRTSIKAIADKTVQTAKQYELEDQVKWAFRQLSARRRLMEVRNDNLNTAMTELEKLRDKNEEYASEITSILGELKVAHRNRERLRLLSYIFENLAKRASISQSSSHDLRAVVKELPDSAMDDLMSSDFEYTKRGLEKIMSLIGAAMRSRAASQLLAKARQKGQGMLGDPKKKDKD